MALEYLCTPLKIVGLALDRGKLLSTIVYQP